MSLFKGLITVMHREICRIKDNTAYLLVLTILPIISFVFWSVLFSKGIPEKLPIAVVDCDHTPLSRQILTMVGATPEIEIRYQATDMLAAEQLLKSGDVYAVLLIPKGFEQDILGLTYANIESYVSGANILANGLITKALLTTITTFSTGIQLQVFQQQGVSSEQALSMAMPIRLDRHPLFNPYANYSYYLSPSFMSMMLLIFTMLSTIFAFGSELRYATSKEWLAATGNSFSVAFWGKFLTIFSAMAVMLCLMFFIQFETMKIPINGNFMMLAVGGVVFLVSYISIAIFIVALTADMRLALSLGGGYAVMAFSFSGLTFPLMAMHESIQLLSHLFPFTYFTNILIDQVMRGAPVQYSLPNIGYMMFFWILPLLTYRRLRHVATEPKYWGKL